MTYIRITRPLRDTLTFWAGAEADALLAEEAERKQRLAEQQAETLRQLRNMPETVDE